MSESLRLAELLCARLCHDLSGLLGSLIGVLEIAREEQADSETLAVAEESAVELGQRLKLFRAAWGQGAEELDMIRLQEFAESVFASRRLRLDLAGLEPDAIFPPRGRADSAQRSPAGGRKHARRRHRRPRRLAGQQPAGDDFRPACGLAGGSRHLAQRRGCGLGGGYRKRAPSPGAACRPHRTCGWLPALDVDAGRS